MLCQEAFSERDHVCRERERKISPQPKQNLGNHLEVQKAFDTLQQYLVLSFIRQLVAPEVYQSLSGAGSSITEMIEVIPNQSSKSLEEYAEDEIRWTGQGGQSLHLVLIVARAKRTCNSLDLR